MIVWVKVNEDIPLKVVMSMNQSRWNVQMERPFPESMDGSLKLQKAR